MNAVMLISFALMIGQYTMGYDSTSINLARGEIDVFSPLKIKFQKGNEIIEKEVKMLFMNEVKSLGIES